MKASGRLLTILFLVLVSAGYLLVGIDQMHQSVDPAYEDTGSYLEGALFIKEHGGIARFPAMCWNGEYKIANQHPLYLLLLSTFASRDLSFFPLAKAATLGIGWLAVLALFAIVRDLYGKTAACLATVLMAFNVGFLNRVSNVTVEPLLILCVLVAWYFMVKGLDDRRKWTWAGFWSGLSYMSKATGMFLIPIFALGSFCIGRWSALKNRYFWLFFVAFGVAASPLLLRNVGSFRQPFHETVNAQLPWMDSKHDLSEKHALALNWREHTFRAENLPTMRSYLATHSPSVIARRLLRGMKSESTILIERLPVSAVPIRRRLAVGLALLALCAFGLATGPDRRRGIYTLVALPVFFVPFAWYMQITREARWVMPLVPLILIYASVAVVQLLEAADRRLASARLGVRLQNVLPTVLGAVLVVVVVQLLASGQLMPLIHDVKLTEDQKDLMEWFRKNIDEDDVVVFRPTTHCDEYLHCSDPYWGLLWHAGFKGTVVMTRRNFPIQADSLEQFRDYLAQRRVNVIVVHEANYASPRLLDDFFDYDDREGLRQVRALEGWRLVYGHSGKPTKFLIYRIDGNEKPPDLAVSGEKPSRAGKQ